MWFEVHKPSIKPDAKFYQPFGAFKFEQKHETHFPEPLGEDLCIIDLDNRPFDVAGQVFGPTVMSWEKDAEKVHGLSVGVLNHWLYGMLPFYLVALPESQQ